jgi:hypothetical protein
MRIESSKVKVACDEKDYGSHGTEPGVPASLAFRGLKQPVYGFDLATCLT